MVTDRQHGPDAWRWGSRRSHIVWCDSAGFHQLAVMPPLRQQARLHTFPASRGEAQAYVSAWHRHLPKPPPGDLARFVVQDEAGIVRGAAIVGRPSARLLSGQGLVEVTRVATDGTPNACSALYGACVRWARKHGHRAVITYTLGEEPGTSLVAAGFQREAVTRGGQWDREGRDRDERDGQVAAAKVRWRRECSAG